MPTSDIISVPTQANQLPLALAIRVPGLQFATEDLPPHAMPTRGFEGLMAALLAPPTLSVPVAPVEPGPPLVTSSTFGSQPQVEPTPSPILETISPLLLSPDPAGQPVAEAATVAVRAPAALPVGLPSVVPLRATPPSSLGDFKRGTTTVHKRVLDNPNLVPKQATPLTQALPVQDLPGPSVLLYAPSLPPSSVSSSPPSESTPTRPPDPLAAVAVVSEFGPIASVLPPTKVLHPQMLPKDTPVRTTHEQDTPPFRGDRPPFACPTGTGPNPASTDGYRSTNTGTRNDGSSCISIDCGTADGIGPWTAPACQSNAWSASTWRSHRPRYSTAFDINRGPARVCDGTATPPLPRPPFHRPLSNWCLCWSRSPTGPATSNTLPCSYSPMGLGISKSRSTARPIPRCKSGSKPNGRRLWRCCNAIRHNCSERSIRPGYPESP